jgi:hypothetical protein
MSNLIGRLIFALILVGLAIVAYRRDRAVRDLNKTRVILVAWAAIVVAVGVLILIEQVAPPVVNTGL